MNDEYANGGGGVFASGSGDMGGGASSYQPQANPHQGQLNPVVAMLQGIGQMLNAAKSQAQPQQQSPGAASALAGAHLGSQGMGGPQGPQQFGDQYGYTGGSHSVLNPTPSPAQPMFPPASQAFYGAGTSMGAPNPPAAQAPSPQQQWNQGPAHAYSNIPQAGTPQTPSPSTAVHAAANPSPVRNLTQGGSGVSAGTGPLPVMPPRVPGTSPGFSVPGGAPGSAGAHHAMEQSRINALGPIPNRSHTGGHNPFGAPTGSGAAPAPPQAPSQPLQFNPQSMLQMLQGVGRALGYYGPPPQPYPHGPGNGATGVTTADPYSQYRLRQMRGQIPQHSTPDRSWNY